MLQLHEGHHHHPSIEGRQQVADSIWAQEHITLVTVGIDIGSSTSHLIFAKVHLQRRTQSLSARYEVVSREILWQSPILFTPFLADGTIDAAALGGFIKAAYDEAGLHAEDVDSGAVILTGEAIKRTNAHAIDELFAAEAGKFVCATAGHRLECVLAAHGSGAVALSKTGGAILHVDIGGGTTKLALIADGRILEVAAYAVGGRLLAQDDSGVWSRMDEAAQDTAADLGVVLHPDSLTDARLRAQIATRLADVLYRVMTRQPDDALTQRLQLTEALTWPVIPERITFSGGVSEYVYGRETRPLGDIARELGLAVRELVDTGSIPLALDALPHGIRATVIGASQFTVQVSGKTTHAENQSMLPLRNVPVVFPQLTLDHVVDSHEVQLAIESACRLREIDRQALMALAFVWQGDPEYSRLRAVCDGIYRALCTPARTTPLVIVIDGDVGRLIGQILVRELGAGSQVISLDGVALQDLDFVDVGQMITPPGVIPLVIKSLVFDAVQSD